MLVDTIRIEKSYLWIVKPKNLVRKIPNIDKWLNTPGTTVKDLECTLKAFKEDGICPSILLKIETKINLLKKLESWQKKPNQKK